MGDLSEAHVWAILSAPFCALFAVRAACAFEKAPRAAVPLSPDVRVTAPAALAVGFSAVTAASATQAIAYVILFCGLLHLALIDLRLMVTPVRASLALAALGVGYAWLDAGALRALECTAAAATGWSSFRLLDRLYVALRGRSGLGSGDALIAAALGAWLSFDGLALSVALAGAATLLAARLGARIGPAQPFPFAPGLALGAFMVVMLRQLA